MIMLVLPRRAENPAKINNPQPGRQIRRLGLEEMKLRGDWWETKLVPE
jgi:hypothetical protein